MLLFDEQVAATMMTFSTIVFFTVQIACSIVGAWALIDLNVEILWLASIVCFHLEKTATKICWRLVDRLSGERTVQ